MVRRPREEVATCCHAPPAYEPRRIPAAVGFDIPVPPLPAASVPVQLGVKVCVLPEDVMVRRMLASEEVAKVCDEPVCAAEYCALSEVMPPPAPASVPQENCLVAASHTSLSAAPAQAERPAPKKVLPA